MSWKHQHVQPTVTDRYVRYACPDLSADASGGLALAPLRFLFFVSPLPPAPLGRSGAPLTDNSISLRPGEVPGFGEPAALTIESSV